MQRCHPPMRHRAGNDAPCDGPRVPPKRRPKVLPSGTTVGLLNGGDGSPRAAGPVPQAGLPQRGGTRPVDIAHPTLYNFVQ